MFYFHCKEAKPYVAMKNNGTIVTVFQNCNSCKKQFSWKSQHYILGKHPAGNILLRNAILMAGASVSTVLLVLQHFGLMVFPVITYFYHQKNYLFPTVVKHWKNYSSALIEALTLEDKIISPPTKIRFLRNISHIFKENTVIFIHNICTHIKCLIGEKNVRICNQTQNCSS